MKHYYKGLLVFLLPLLFSTRTYAQMSDDAIMMSKKTFCVGGMYMYSGFDHFWEGTFKRGNLNYGTTSMQSVGFMGTYGIIKNLNVLVSLPYVYTHATAGTLHGMQGLQDLSIWLKWKPITLKSPIGRFSFLAEGGLSFPTTNYLADYLPLAIGMKSRTLNGRIMADYQTHHFFVTASDVFTLRSDIAIDRNSYYTTSLHLTDQVDMPNTNGANLRIGYRTSYIIAEAVMNNMTTLGGFDITKNNMPFPSNRMNWTDVGVNFKYEFSKVLKGLTLFAGANYVIHARNYGQQKMVNGGIFYTFGI